MFARTKDLESAKITPPVSDTVSELQPMSEKLPEPENVKVGERFPLMKQPINLTVLEEA
jgi:hypothetical protein